MLKRVAECNKYKNRDRNASAPHEEYQYLNLLQDILDEGHDEVGRNGNTRCVFGAAMHFSLENGKIPILTTKKTAWKTCLKELLWFIKGQTDNKILTDQNVHIWDGNTTPEFLESRGLSHYTPGRQIGPLYSHQWRFWNAKYENDPDADYTGPALKGWSTRVPSPDWIYKWVANPAQMIATDAYAKTLFEKWKPTVMTSFSNLKKVEVDAILKYVDDYNRKVKENPWNPINHISSLHMQPANRLIT